MVRFYDFPEAHWKHLRGSASSTPRHHCIPSHQFPVVPMNTRNSIAYEVVTWITRFPLGTRGFPAVSLFSHKRFPFFPAN